MLVARSSYLLIIFLVLLTLLPEDAEARRRGRRRRGAAMRVSMRQRPPQRRQNNQGRQVAQQGRGNFQGLGRQLEEGRNSRFDNRFNNRGLAFDENRILDGSFDGNNFNNVNDLQQVVLNGQRLLVARDRNGNLFPLSENFVNRQGQLVVDPTNLASTSPLVRLRNGQVLRVDSRGQRVSSAVARDLSIMGEGGLVR